MLRKHYFLLFVLLLSVSANAQTPAPRQYYSRNSFWTETVLNGTIKGKVKWQLDYQYRRSSDASDVTNASGNPFKNAFQHVYRPWVHYQLSESIRLSLSPLGFWESYYPATESNGVRKIQPELRICPQVTVANKIGRVAIDQRYRFEYRMIGNKVTDANTNEFGYGQGFDYPMSARKFRFRYFFRAIVPLGNHTKLEANTWYINTWNELFLGLGHNVNNDKLLDQNRTFCLLGYKLNTQVPLRLEAGYGLQMAPKFAGSLNASNDLVETSNKLEKNNILQLYIIVEDFNKLFKLKK